MTIVAKFTKGAKTLDVSTSPYTVDFVPPSAAPALNMAEGTSLNRTGGADLVSVKYSNREMTVSVRILGALESTIREAANRLVRFTSQSSDAEPLYFEYKPNSTLIDPSWGQLGAALRYEVVGCTAAVQDTYNIDTIRSQGYRVILNLVVKPFALGSEQILCVAAGGVGEDTAGAADGLSRGLMVPGAGTNLFTNPVFGASTWNTGWTAGAGLITAQNTDPEFYLFGTCSAHVYAFAAGRSYTQSINVGNTNTHVFSYYAKRPDGSTITSSDVGLNYGSGQTCTYTAVGNGWYRISATVAGTASAIAAGAIVLTDVYVDGFQAEQSPFITPMMHGDLLGCAWTGSSHASTSARTAGTVKLPESGVLSTGQGAICMVWTPIASNTTLGTSANFFAQDAGTLRSFFFNADNKFYLRGGTSDITSAATVYGPGTAVVMHSVWGPSGLAFYINGAQIGTNTYTAQTQGTSLYVGGHNIAGYNCGGVINGCTVFPRELGSAEVAAHYTAISGMVSTGKRADYIPYLWTKDGDNQVDNCNDSTRDNFAAVNGVPGSDAARTAFTLTSDGSYWATSFWLGSHQDWGQFRKPENSFYVERSGTAEAGNSGGEFSMATVSNFYSATVTAPSSFNEPVHLFVRARSNGTGSTRIDYYPAYNTNMGLVLGALKPCLSLGTNYELRYLGQMQVDVASWAPADAAQLNIGAWTDYIGSPDVREDFFVMMPGAVAVVVPYINSMGSSMGGASPDVIYLSGNKVAYSRGTYRMYYSPELRGDSIEVYPNTWNTLLSIIASDAGTFDLTRTFTYTSVKITPRWGLI